MVGTSISGAIFQYVGYYTIFGMSASLACFGVLYVSFVVKESLGQRRGREEEKCPDPMNNLEQDRREDDGLR